MTTVTVEKQNEPTYDHPIFNAYIKHDGVAEKFTLIYDEINKLARMINVMPLSGREKSLAFTKLQEARYWCGEGLKTGYATGLAGTL